MDDELKPAAEAENAGPAAGETSRAIEESAPVGESAGKTGDAAVSPPGDSADPAMSPPGGATDPAARKNGDLAVTTPAPTVDPVVDPVADTVVTPIDPTLVDIPAAVPAATRVSPVSALPADTSDAPDLPSLSGDDDAADSADSAKSTNGAPTAAATAAALAAAEDDAAREATSKTGYGAKSETALETAPQEEPRRSSPPIATDAPPWESPGRPRNAIIGMVLVLALLGVAGLVGWVLFKPTADEPTGAVGEASGPCDMRTVDELPGGGGEPVFGQAPPRQTVTIVTNLGNVTAMLFGDLAPCGVTSFANLAARSYYTSKACPEMTTAMTEPTLVLRCGEPAGQGGPGYRVRGEHPFADAPVVDALALVNDERGLSGGEFAFVRGQSIPTNNLTVIGQVIDGFGILDSIAATGGGQTFTGAPPQPITILSVTVLSSANGLPPVVPSTSGSVSPGASPRPSSPGVSPRPSGSSRSPKVPFGRD